jgi:hypothetical protein
VSKYYFLIAGLPEIRFEEYKLQITLLEFKQLLKDNLDKGDFELVTLFYQKFDNDNLLKFLKNPDAQFDPRGSISADAFADLVFQLKDQENFKDKRYPDYYLKFILAYLNDQPLIPSLSWEDQLSTLYLDDAIKCGNQFIAAWYEFNLNITNIFTAINSRNYSIDLSGSIVGTNEIAETIRASNAKDFGIGSLFPYFDEVMRIADETNLLERERKTDLLKWSWMVENTVYKYFSIENIFSYLLQTEILERWMSLNQEFGKKVFKEFIDKLRGSFEFPDEYKLIK